jgi:hypothetical protein
VRRGPGQLKPSDAIKPDATVINCPSSIGLALWRLARNIDSRAFLPHAGGMLSAEEQAVLDYLATGPGGFFSAREICRRAGRKEWWDKNPRWALPILSRLETLGRIETDPAGHFRLRPERGP